MTALVPTWDTGDINLRATYALGILDTGTATQIIAPIQHGVACYDAVGAQVWTYSGIVSGYDVRDITAADLTGSGHADHVIVASGYYPTATDGKWVILDAAGNEVQLVRGSDFVTSPSRCYSIAVDGTDIYIGTDLGLSKFVKSGSAWTHAWTGDVGGIINVQIDDAGNGTRVYASSNTPGSMNCYQTDGTLDWSYLISNTYVNSFTVAKLDPNKTGKQIAVGRQSALLVLDKDGALSASITTSNVCSSVIAYDHDGDGVADLYHTDMGRNVVRYANTSLDTYTQVAKVTPLPSGQYAGLAHYDINDDGVDEIFVYTTDGHCLVYDVDLTTQMHNLNIGHGIAGGYYAANGFKGNGIAFPDLNGDGHGDLVIAGSTGYVDVFTSSGFTPTSLTVTTDGTDSSTVFSTAQARVHVGAGQSMFFYFDSVAIPQGATISSLALTIRSSGGNASLSAKCYAVAEDDAAVFSSHADFATRSRTAAVDWSTVWTNAIYYTTPDLSAIVQEVVNRPGWASGNSLLITVEDNAMATTSDAYSVVAVGTTNDPVLQYEYVGTAPTSQDESGGSAAAITVSTTGDGASREAPQGGSTATVDVQASGVGTKREVTYWSDPETVTVGGAAEGVATGSLTISGSATGKKPTKGTASGAVSFLGTGAGERNPKGSAAGDLSVSGDASGDAPANRGTAQGTLSVVGVAVGYKSPRASGYGSWVATGGAIGKRTAQGAGSGAATFVGSATGRRNSSGTASGTLSFKSAAVGQAHPRGSASGTWIFGVTASGYTARSGSGAGTWTNVNNAAGHKSSKGIAASTWSIVSLASGGSTRGGKSTGTTTYVGTANGVGPDVEARRGQATGELSFVGNAVGHRAAQGVATSSWAVAGAATGTKLSKGTATGSTSFVEAASGFRESRGEATSETEFSGTATGLKASSGIATGVVNYSTGVVTGVRTPRGSASGSTSYHIQASGHESPVAQGVGSYAYAGAATGRKLAKADSSGNVEWTTTADGQTPTLLPHEGTASGQVVYTSASGATRSSSGSASGATVWAATAVSTSLREGIAEGSLAWNGEAQGSNLLRDIIISSILLPRAWSAGLKSRTYKGSELLPRAYKASVDSRRWDAVVSSRQWKASR